MNSKIINFRENSNKSKKVFYIFLGTTAELIKVAPVIAEMEKRSLSFRIISSGQNDLNFGELGHIIKKEKADYVLRMKPIRFTRNIYIKFIVWLAKAFVNQFLYFRNILKDKNTDKIVIVHGDTITTLLGSICAKINGAKLVHIESGLRSFNFLEPFPEEISRFIASRLVDVHFCPNKWAVNNLRQVKGIKINTFSNTSFETLLKTLDFKKSRDLNIWGKYFLLIIHRQEHLLFKGKNLSRQLIKLFSEYAKHDLKCVLVLHPVTKNFLKKEGLWEDVKRNKNIILTPRVSYKKFIELMWNADFIATDGGSNQEECYYMGKPSIILRGVTERIEGLNKNVILSKNNLKVVSDFVVNYRKFKKKPIKSKTSPSKIIVDYLTKMI